MMPSTPVPRYLRNEKLLAASLGGEETALLSVASGKYYGLNPPAARIWALLANPMSLEEICLVLMAEFEVHESQCRRDAAALIAEMVREGVAYVAPAES